MVVGGWVGWVAGEVMEAVSPCLASCARMGRRQWLRRRAGEARSQPARQSMLSGNKAASSACQPQESPHPHGPPPSAI